MPSSHVISSVVGSISPKLEAAMHTVGSKTATGPRGPLSVSTILPVTRQLRPTEFSNAGNKPFFQKNITTEKKRSLTRVIKSPADVAQLMKLTDLSTMDPITSTHSHMLAETLVVTKDLNPAGRCPKTQGAHERTGISPLNASAS